MKTERFILSFIAVLTGLIVAGIAFFFYQLSTKQKPEHKTAVISLAVTPTPVVNSQNFITVDQPTDEDVITSKTVKISGKTVKNTTLIISTSSSDQVATPDDNGDFSLTTTIGDDTNLIKIVAIFPDGEEKTVNKVISYSSENF